MTNLANARVLVVEDDPLSGKFLSVVLAGEGCDVRLVRTGEEALAILPVFLPSALVIDLVLPTMSGVLLAQRLKTDPLTRSIVLVAVTALNGLESERIAKEAGFVAIVRKPIDPMRFTTVLADALEGAK